MWFTTTPRHDLLVCGGRFPHRYQLGLLKHKLRHRTRKGPNGVRETVPVVHTKISAQGIPDADAQQAWAGRGQYWTMREKVQHSKDQLGQAP